MSIDKKKFSVVTHETSDGRQMVGMFDMSASAPDNDLPVSVWIKILLKQPNQKGLPTDAEAGDLNKIEDEIEKLISGRFVGRITFDGTRELYFYVKDASTANVSLENFRNVSFYDFEFEVKNDPEWAIVASYITKII